MAHQIEGFVSNQSLLISDNLFFDGNLFIEMMMYTAKLNTFMIIDRSWNDIYALISTHLSCYNHRAITSLISYLRLSSLISGINSYLDMFATFIDSLNINEEMFIDEIDRANDYLHGIWTQIYNFIKPYKPTLNPLLQVIVNLVSDLAHSCINFGQYDFQFRSSSDLATTAVPPVTTPAPAISTGSQKCD